MIEIEEIHHLKNIDLKYKQTKYPQCKDPNVPRLFFVSLFIGSKGSGKTYSACQLLKLYETFGIFHKGHEVIQRIILISPTTSANPVFKSLKYLDEQDIFEDYSDDLLLDIVEDIKKEKENTEKYLKEIKAWKRFCKCKDVDELSHEDILLLHKNDFNEPIKPRFDKMVVNHIILDDLVGSSAYKSTGRSALNNILLKSRHLSINFFIMSQNLKAIPKTIRTNTSVFCSAHGNQAISVGVGSAHGNQSASIGIQAHPHMNSIAVGTGNPLMNSIGTNTNIQSTSIGVGTSHQSASIAVGPDAEQQQVVVQQNPLYNQNVIIEEVPPEPQIIPPAILAPPVLHIGPPEQQMVLYGGNRGRGRPPLSRRGEMTARERELARREVLYLHGTEKHTPKKKRKEGD
jgi:hypothetical protein